MGAGGIMVTDDVVRDRDRGRDDARKVNIRARVITVPIGGGGGASMSAIERMGLVRKGERKADDGDGASPAGSELQSRQLAIEKKWLALENAGRIIRPPFDQESLAKIPEESSTLNQCVDAMGVNVHGFGWELVYVGPDAEDEEGEDGKIKPKEGTGENSPAAQAEKVRIENFLKSVNPRESFLSLRKKWCRDYETTGNAYIEVISNIGGEIQWLEHLPAATVCLGPIDKEPQAVDVTFVGVDGQAFSKQGWVWYRRFAQLVDRKSVWFKEFGDERIVRARDGKIVEEGQIEPRERATELIHYCQYSSRTPYGIPRYIGNLISIRGARSSEILNYNYFERNAIPPLIVLVSGGTLTEESFETLEKTLKESAGGLQNAWATVVLEAVPQGSGMDDKGNVHIATKSMRDDRLSDGLFQQYDQNCIAKMRSSFRLAPIYIGRAEDYSFASAQASRTTTEEQVFQPERVAFDEVINLKILRRMGVQYWEFYSKGPEIADVETYTKAVETFESVGAMTPNVAIGLANELLGTELPEIDDPWGGVPFTFSSKLVELGKKVVGLEDVVEPPAEPPPAFAANAAAAAAGKPPPAPPQQGNGRDVEGAQAQPTTKALGELARNLRLFGELVGDPEKRRKFEEAAEAIERLPVAAGEAGA